MKPQVNFRNMPASEALASLVEARLEKVRHVCDRIQSCEVLIERSTHHNKGRVFHVRVHLAMPGHDVVVGRDPAEVFTHEDPRDAIRDAFRVAGRSVAEHAARIRHEPERSGATIRRAEAIS
jgi:ribosome-associated translation inhibitor RaiA